MHSVFSSAVPVLPATVTPLIAAEVPVPSRTTSIISRRTVRATLALVTCAPGGGCASGVNVGLGRRPPSAIVAATIAICSGAGQNLALADRRRADVEFALDLEAGGSVLSAAPSMPGGWLKPNAFGHRDQPRRRRA